ncbi:MAG: hypothetical protein V1875_02815 [Candidatus Altiarchaeota archaeon]
MKGYMIILLVLLLVLTGSGCLCCGGCGPSGFADSSYDYDDNWGDSGGISGELQVPAATE